jgi:UDP-N-acetylglucosamine 4,6-dehydratase
MGSLLRDFSFKPSDLRDKSVLITGGTGSFGAAFVRHAIETLKVGRLVVFSRDEFKQFEMQQIYPHSKYPQLRFFVGDVRDFERLKLATRGIDVIVHAAALKQVIAMEYNPFECVQTNVHGAQNVVLAAIENQVKRVIALSTDKAAEPINLYGASKCVSDKIFVAAMNVRTKTDPIFSIVRYGNVVNSRGSVIPFFRRLLANGTGHLPITDARMTRFIITLQQGVDFVCSCLSLMRGGEIFVPKIPSIRITDLAEAMAPGLEQRAVGIRPGEKIHEVLVPHANAHSTLEAEQFFVIAPELAFATYVPPPDIELRAVGADFSYDSLGNKEYLGVEEIRDLLKDT